MRFICSIDWEQVCAETTARPHYASIHCQLPGARQARIWQFAASPLRCYITAFADFYHWRSRTFVLIFAVDSLARLSGLVAGSVVGGIVYICQRGHLMRGHAAALFLILLAVLLAAAIAWVPFKLPPPLRAGQIINGVYHGPVEPGLPVSLIDAHRLPAPVSHRQASRLP